MFPLSLSSRFRAGALPLAVRVLLASLATVAIPARADDLARHLNTGTAAHAFDHLGNLGHQADAAAASGATVIYATGLGGVGYGGLPASPELDRLMAGESAYSAAAHRQGIRIVLGYVCATSIVGLEGFDRNWPPALRSSFRTPPSEWRQQGRDGRPLPSWYGGDYQPACMNHPDWRAYERHVVGLQLATGHDGIFFDNPTVHPQGCYCPHCMAKFAKYLAHEERVAVPDRSLEAVRSLADRHPAAFARFRCTIARDFFADMRRHARSINPKALVTANNSLNSADALYAQCRTHAYNLAEMSRTEDFVVVEDMSSQPRVLPDGRVIEYGPTYRQVQSLIRGRPLVAVTIAEADYHTPPNLVRLALAEAAANDASYLVWTTWPEEQRARLVAATRRQVDFLRQHADLLQGTTPRADVRLFLPFRRWVDTNRCAASKLAGELSRANLPYAVVADEGFHRSSLRGSRVLVTESRSVFNPAERRVVESFERRGGRVVAVDGRPDWLEEVRRALGEPSVSLDGPSTLRLAVRDQGRRTVAHLLNLNIRRISSFEDVVTPASNITVQLTVPVKRPRRVRALTADAGGTVGELAFTSHATAGGTQIEVVVPRVDIATMVVVE